MIVITSGHLGSRGSRYFKKNARNSDAIPVWVVPLKAGIFCSRASINEAPKGPAAEALGSHIDPRLIKTRLEPSDGSPKKIGKNEAINEPNNTKNVAFRAPFANSR